LPEIVLEFTRQNSAKSASLEKQGERIVDLDTSSVLVQSKS